MAKVNLSKAALLAGKNRTTIWRHIKQGKVSIERDRDGNPMVDTSELIRVYGEIKPIATPKSKKFQQQTTDALNELLSKYESLKVEQGKLIEEIADLKRRLTYSPPEPEKNTTENKVEERPEDDPEWPKEVLTMEDLALRNQIRARYRLKNQG